ncbi:MAG: HAD family phosphatase [Pseudomonadota bacterium]
MRPDAVLFDCDGVLVDSEPVTDRVIIANLARYGIAVSAAEVTEYFLGGTLAGVGEKARAQGADLPKGWVDEIYAETFDALRRGTPLIKGVPDLLDRLDALGIPFGVGSNGPRAKMEITLGQNGLWERCKDKMVSAHDGVPAKPAPDIYLKLASLLGADPARCVVVDDSPSGAKGGLAAGCKVIAYAERTPEALLAPLGVPIARTMSDVAAMMGVANDQDGTV